MKTAIIGGGALGLTAALRRAESGDAVTVYEAAPQVGGLAAGFDVALPGHAPIRLEVFYHHLFETDHAVLRVIAEVGLNADMVWDTPPTCTLLGGQIHRMDGVFASGHALAGTHLDTALALLRFAPLSFADRVRFGAMGARLKFTPSHEVFAGQTAADWARTVAGDAAFETVLLPLLRGKFGEEAYPRVALSWLWSRFHERTQRLGYLRGGFDRLYETMAARITAAGGTIRWNAPVVRLQSGTTGVAATTAGGDTETFDRVVVTTPTETFLRMAQSDLPDDYVSRYARAIAHRAAHCLVLSLPARFGTFYWLNVNDPGYPFLALVEHTNFVPASDYAGQHLLYIGNYVAPDDPLLRETATDTLTRFAPFLKQIAPGFDAANVRQAWSFAAQNAQPIVTTDYESRLPPHETPLPNVFLANMAHVYPQDRGQNYSVQLGERMAKLL